jgi:hypothetical protein
VLTAIGRAAGAAVVVQGDLGSAPAQHLQAVELAAAIRRLAGWTTAS